MAKHPGMKRTKRYEFESLESRSLMAVFTGTLNPSPYPTLADDALENNDSVMMAANLGVVNGTINIGNLMLNDSADWYKFTMSGRGVAGNQVRIDFNTGAGNLDFQLYAANTALISTSATNNNAEGFSLNGMAAGTYYVRVYGRSGAKNDSYTLGLSTNPVSPAANPNVDLAGFSLTAAPEGTFGATIATTAQFINYGTTTSGNFVAQWYLSRDTKYSADDILLTRTGGLSYASIAGTSVGKGFESLPTVYQLNMPAALPAGWTGTNFFIVMRTDSLNSVGERNEANNSGVGLTIDSAKVTLTTAVPTTSGFNITLNFSGALSGGQKAAFAAAAKQWEKIIIGDLPTASYRGILVDDLQIEAAGIFIDGSGGILGQAGPDAFRSRAQGGLPYHGVMQFDTFDLADLEADGSLYSVILHEMGHVLGIGTLWGPFLVDISPPTSPLPDTRFFGNNATREFNAYFGTTEPGVPVEDFYGPGTALSHWRESTMIDELMTGFAEQYAPMPISRVTVGSLQDIGYRVNYAAANYWIAPPFSGPPFLRAGARASSTTSAAARMPYLMAGVTPEAMRTVPSQTTSAPFRFAVPYIPLKSADFGSTASSFRTGSTESRARLATVPSKSNLGGGLSERIATRLRNDVLADDQKTLKSEESRDEASMFDVEQGTAAWSLLFAEESLDFLNAG